MGELFNLRHRRVDVDLGDTSRIERGLVHAAFPFQRGIFFSAADGDGVRAGGGGSPREPEYEPRPASKKRAELKLDRAKEIAQAYRDLALPAEALVAQIPQELFGGSSENAILPARLRDPSQWREIPRSLDATRPYLHRYLSATEGDWFIHLRWHTPTPEATWASSLPECAMERRWRHYVAEPAVRPYHVLLLNYNGVPEAARDALAQFLNGRGFNSEQEIVSVGAHAWLGMAAYRELSVLHPRKTEWLRPVRDAAHWPGHPAGYEIPACCARKWP